MKCAGVGLIKVIFHFKQDEMRGAGERPKEPY